MQFGIGRKRIIFAPPCALRQGGPRAPYQVRKAWAPSPISAFLNCIPVGLSSAPEQKTGKGNAQAQSRRGEHLLRGSWQRPAADPDPWLLLDIGHVAGTDCCPFAALQARALGHARPRPVRLPGKSSGL